MGGGEEVEILIDIIYKVIKNNLKQLSVFGKIVILGDGIWSCLFWIDVVLLGFSHTF